MEEQHLQLNESKVIEEHTRLSFNDTVPVSSCTPFTGVYED